MSRTDAARLKAFLQTLPQTDRYILLLTYADGLTPAEVALVLDLSEPTVRSRFEVLRREAEIAMRDLPEAPAPEIAAGITPAHLAPPPPPVPAALSATV